MRHYTLQEAIDIGKMACVLYKTTEMRRDLIDEEYKMALHGLSGEAEQELHNIFGKSEGRINPENFGDRWLITMLCGESVSKLVRQYDAKMRTLTQQKIVNKLIELGYEDLRLFDNCHLVPVYQILVPAKKTLPFRPAVWHIELADYDHGCLEIYRRRDINPEKIHWSEVASKAIKIPIPNAVQDGKKLLNKLTSSRKNN